ncbi:MAG: ABC transporter permease [Candidatus Koribacter versatilis]|uniref:ABC transporter permease n=1 Tax=Candidatus Korobacter versatilis TaxID=658062 RepID=A0A932A7Z8_9BACT|nr:ABC transporter permease [Candidatus Koribacter versatilis]
MNRMVVSNLVHRPLRSLISIVAIAVEVTLILVIVSFALGMLKDATARQKGIGADLMVQPPGSSTFIGLSGAPVSQKIAGVIRQKVPHVTAAVPVTTQVTTSGNLEVINGIALPPFGDPADSFENVSGPFHYMAGGPFEKADDIIVDDIFARSKNIKIGSKVEVLNHQFRVCGIVEHGKGARKFLPMATLQELTGAQGKASIFYVKLDDARNADEAHRAVNAIPGMEQYVVRSMQEYMSLMTPEHVPGLSAFITVVIGVAVVIGFIVIFQAMYTAVMERTREIGILKSLGASKVYIIRLILRETILLAVVGIVLGIVVSYSVSMTIVRYVPTLQVRIDRMWLVYAALIAVTGALLGALYPAFKAAQKDPIDALAYE